MSEPASYITCMYELGVRLRNFVSAKKVGSDRGRLFMSSPGLHTNAYTCIHIPYRNSHLHTYKHTYIQASHAHSSKKGKKKDKNSKIKQKTNLRGIIGPTLQTLCI